ncbi:MAG: cytochrome c oxidase subunit 2 [Fimbriimonadales bacterium]|nr:cytochrome c oxidase subunit II [Armatimonadota bacterium]MBV6503598.1 cytochrome c oxidase subunit 2 [Fimbriimonadales bacterium]NOG92649.1 cytochrome c oxidase subunit II [Armatimonadota bacterium]
MMLAQFLPEQASEFAPQIDFLYLLLVALTAFFTLGIKAVIIYFIVKYRQGKKADRSNPQHHHTKLELTWTILPTLMLVPIFWWNAELFINMYEPLDVSKARNSLEIYVVGKQWMWHLQHPTGQRENNELHIPVGRPIKLTMIAQDVLHSFYVPAFRVKKDVVPGRYTTQWFVPTKVGKYHLFCAEYCGTKHSEMGGYVYVMEPEDYEKWLEDARWGMGNFRSAETMEAAGKRLFTELKCVDCHGEKATKRVPLDGIYGTERLLSDGRRVVADDEYLRRSILDPGAMKVAGHEPIMPPYAGRVLEQEILELITYIKSLSAKPEPVGKPAAEASEARGTE